MKSVLKYWSVWWLFPSNHLSLPHSLKSHSLCLLPSYSLCLYPSLDFKSMSYPSLSLHVLLLSVHVNPLQLIHPHHHLFHMLHLSLHLLHLNHLNLTYLFPFHLSVHLLHLQSFKPHVSISISSICPSSPSSIT